MISIGFDPAKRYGIAVYDQDIGIVFENVRDFISLQELYLYIRDIVDIYKPDAFILAQAAGRFQKTIWQHGKYSVYVAHSSCYGNISHGYRYGCIVTIQYIVSVAANMVWQHG